MEDKDFVPNEYSSEEFGESDDEDTLAEEERLASENPIDVKEELDDLANEADLPIEELLAKYGYNSSPQQQIENDITESEEDSYEEDGDDDQADSDDKDTFKNGITPKPNVSITTTGKRKSASPTPNDKKKNEDHQHEANKNHKKMCHETNGENIGKDSQNDHIVEDKEIQNSRYPHQRLLDTNIHKNYPSTSHKGLLLSPLRNNSSNSYGAFYQLIDKTDIKALLYSEHVEANDSSSDEDYQPIEAWKKQIQVGKEYQADMTIIHYLADESERKRFLKHYPDCGQLLWDPYGLPENKVKQFLIEVNKFLIEAAISAEKEIMLREEAKRVSPVAGISTGYVSIPINTAKVEMSEEESRLIQNPPPVPLNYKSPKKSPAHHSTTTSLHQATNISQQTTVLKASGKGIKNIHDNPDALFLLMKCLFNVEDALNKIKYGQALKKATPTPWSENDCVNFETGLQIYNKDFFRIHLNYLPHKTVGEIVQFYYFWKKSERHDTFAARYRIEKKQYTLHPGITDFMDRLVDDTTHTINPLQTTASSSTSPSQIPLAPEGDNYVTTLADGNSTPSMTHKLTLRGQPGTKLRVVPAYECQGRDMG